MRAVQTHALVGCWVDSAINGASAGDQVIECDGEGALIVRLQLQHHPNFEPLHNAAMRVAM